MRRFTDILSRPLNRLQRRFERSRPGSILIFVIALLVLLALMGTAYIATARQDRFAASVGNSGDDVNRELANALQAAIDDASASVTQDVSPVTCATPGFDSTIAPSLYLASRAPYLDMHPNDTTTKTLQPTWATISRVKGRKYEAIFYNPAFPAAPQQQYQPLTQYDFTGTDAAPAMLTGGGTPPTTGRAAWHVVPTNIVITYSASNPGTSPALDGRTYVYPAFIRWRYGTDPNPLPNSVALTSLTSSNIITEGPFIAGDATGWGVADSAMFKLNSTKSLTYYAGIRIVDNASGINVNTAWDTSEDPDFNTPANSYNFFLTDVDLMGLLYKLNNAATNATNEMRGINFFRLRNGWNGTAPAAMPAPDRENGTTRTDIKWRNAADAMHHQYARRLNFPNRRWGDTTGTKTYARAFDAPDQPYSETAALDYRGVMTNQTAAISYFETEVLRFIDAGGTNPSRPDSFDRATLNFTTNPTNQFSFVNPNNVGYWYDWNFNFDGVSAPSAISKVIYPLAASNTIGSRVDGGVFRTPRGLVVAGNPVRNTPPVMGVLTSPKVPSNVVATGAIALDTMPSWANAPHKTSLNTAGFGELWRAFWNVMAEAPAQGNTSEMFHAPGVDTAVNPSTSPDSAVNMFSNPLRDPQNANSDPTSGRGHSTPASAKLRLDCYNTLLLRSALAAVNAMNFRDSSGMQGTNKVGIVRSKDIKINALDSAGTIVPVTVHVYGNEAQPFITEVFANTNIDKSQDPKTMDKINPKGYVAVQLYNPYPVTLDLSKYTLWYVNRTKASGNYPNLAYKPIKITTPLPTLAPNTYLTLENFDPATAGNNTTDAAYRPSYVTGDETAHPDMVTVRELYKVLEDPADVNVGGEFVIMRPNDQSVSPPVAVKDVVPVDSYDFTGLKLMQDPNGTPKPDPKVNTANAWHYWRASGNTTATSWKCVYPGRYNVNTTAAKSSRHEGTKAETPWNSTTPEPWVNAAPPDPFHFSPGGQPTACYPNPFPGIRLNNDMFSRSTKYGANGTGNLFPFGGFARVGDVEMIPFIGAYTIEPTSGTPPAAGFLAAEANSISIDSSYADDGETANDAYENIGRFCPLRDPTPSVGGYDDYAPYGAYPNTTNPPASPTGAPLAKYTYHWAMDVFDNFTAVVNPQDDYLPNIAPTTLLNPRGWPGTAPDAVPNGPVARGTTPVATTVNNGKEDLKPVEGLINVNTAPWQVLARIQWYPPAAPMPTGYTSVAAFNQQIAQWVVRYRDVDGGTTDTNGDPVPHGPFNSLLELNGVFQGAIPGGAAADKTKTLKNAFGNLPATMPDAKWGNYAVDSGVAAFPSIATQLGPDFANETLMVTRVSNLLTTRSDSFTAYVVVQGWRNIGTAYPELVVQRRAALVLDRSGSTSGGSNNSVLSYSVPSK